MFDTRSQRGADEMVATAYCQSLAKTHRRNSVVLIAVPVTN